ncbi:MAG: divergent polysaccharide deacetylase family protein [Candidatus Cloacimonas sp.]|jgi:polysaccharide deacetylase 2 family uncharacterized protein YibQ|nr:divergent polysaccharide deacetylase family protein [Candidatus Cloacimonas sp.]
MPKAKKKTPVRVRRSKKKSSLGLYLLAGVAAVFALWFLIREPLPPETNNKSYANEEPTVAAKHKDKKQTKKKHANKKIASKKQNHKKHADKKPESSATASHKPAKQAKKSKAEPVVQPVVVDLEVYIKGAIDKLGINKTFYRRRKKADTITYSVPIDRSSMDLIYANMIFKGELERGGGKLIKGIEGTAKQSLIFSSSHDRNKYIIDIYYDKKLYAEKKNPRTIAIVVDDFGAIGGDLLDGFLAVDKNVCFAIFPDEKNSVLTMERATAMRRETIIHVPMEPIGYPKINPGKNAIFMQYDEGTIDKLLNHFIKQLPDCKGINNHMGSLATTDEDLMRSVMTTLKKHNMFFLDSRTSNVSVAYSIAQKAHLKAYRNDIFLDSPNISTANLNAKLAQIIDLSATRNNVIAITHCHSKEKLQYLKTFISRLKAAGFTVVPLSQIGHYNVPELL